MRMPIVARMLAGIAILGVGACKTESTVEPLITGLRVLRGDAVTDTILTTLDQTLLIEVRSQGEPVSGALVRFVPIQRAGQPDVYITSPSSDMFATDHYDRTNFLGVVAVHVKLGVHVGAAKLHVSAPDLGFEDTARYTITAGNPAQIVVTPADTTLLPGASFQASATVADAWGNPRPEVPTYSPVAGVSVTSTGMVTAGPNIARASYVATVGVAVDTARVSIVPDDTLVAYRAGRVVSFNLDGSGYEEIAAIFYLDVLALAPARSLVFAGNLQPPLTWLHTTDLAGNVQQLGTPGDSGLSWASWPTYSPDGQTLYFSGYTPASQYSLWRANADGSNPTLMYAHSSGYAWRGSVSRDGTRLAFVEENPAFIRVYTIASGTVSSWRVAGHSPRWSPTSDSIAFVPQFGGPIHLMNADGTGVRQVSARGYGEISFAWSPDGVWIVAQSETLELVHVASGLTLPLAHTAGFIAPAWKP